jgi:hypothetical protein
MKTLKSTTIMLLVSLLMGSGCSKDDLTPKTHKGANTLSCRVNGKVFTAKTIWVFGGINGTEATYRDNTIYINASGPGILDQYDSIEITLENPSNNKIYNIPDGILLNTKPVSCSYTLDEDYVGLGPAYFKITYFDGKIVAGEFSFRGVDDENTKKEISITNGRFDIQITTK